MRQLVLDLIQAEPWFLLLGAIGLVCVGAALWDCVAYTRALGRSRWHRARVIGIDQHRTQRREALARLQADYQRRRRTELDAAVARDEGYRLNQFVSQQSDARR